jgi:glycosyltransferase involved in cell wall biosynthesis
MTMGHLVLSGMARRYRLDLVHDPNGIALLGGPRSRTRWIVTLHDAFAYVQPQLHNRLDNWRYRWMLPRLIRRADSVITVSQCSRQDLIHHLKLPDEQVRVIAEGVDEKFRPIVDERERRQVLARYGIKPPYLLYLGAITARKNITQLLEAFARVCQRHPDLILVVGGKRQWHTDEVDMALAHGESMQQVHFTGYVRDADLPALYSAASAFVFPSSYEGFGLPPLEAMACGTPVITSNTSSLPEVVGDAALTINPSDVDELAAAIERALTDQNLRADLRRRGLARAARFTWERTARETLDAYEHVLQGQTTRSLS